MDHPWYISLLKYAFELVVAFLGVSLVMKLAYRNREPKQRMETSCRLVQPIATLIIGMACFAFSAFLAAQSLDSENETSSIPIFFFLGVAGLLGLVLVAEYFLARRAATSTILRLVMFMAYVVSGAALMFGTLASDNETSSIPTASFFAAVAIISLVLVAEYFLARHEVTPLGLRYGGLSRLKPGYLEWSRVTRLGYNDYMMWFTVETDSGEAARIAITLNGIQKFASAALAGVPASAMDKGARALLSRISEGGSIY